MLSARSTFSLTHFPFVYSILKGASSNNEGNASDPALRRPSITSRLLGKRKASTPAAEQPDTKRSTVEVPRSSERSNDTETPTTSFSNSISDKPTQLTTVETMEIVNTESTQSERDDAKSSSNSSDSKAAPAGEVPRDVPVQQNEHKHKEVVTLDDSDSSDEVDLCDAPPPATPKKDAQVTEEYAAAKTRELPAKSFTRVSPPGKEKPPTMSTKHSAAASGSPTRFGVFHRSESKSTSPVPCHYCPKAGYQSAVKTCLVCGASMCKEHLRPHLESPVFQNHTLVPPMEDISTWRCQEHQEINRIYCRQCGVCVCTVCTVIGSHRDHVCISIREAERELRVSGDFAAPYILYIYSTLC